MKNYASYQKALVSHTLEKEIYSVLPSLRANDSSPNLEADDITALLRVNDSTCLIHQPLDGDASSHRHMPFGPERGKFYIIIITGRTINYDFKSWKTPKWRGAKKWVILEKEVRQRIKVLNS
ncbi:hypothetical protein ACTXT7_010525 [Hymenolepis weldensis]